MIQSAPVQPGMNPMQAGQANPLAELFHNIAPLNPKPVLPPQPAPPPVKTDDRLPLDVVASIQKLYLPPAPMNLKGNPGLDPQPGWGGRGR